MSGEHSGTEGARRSRLRWLTLGEAVAVSALLISALGLWNSWRSGREEPETVIEQRAAVRLALRGDPLDDGKRLEISAVESGHALDSLAVKVTPAARPIEVGSDGLLSASAVESALDDAADTGKGPHRVRVQIAARYIEAGQEREATGSYVLGYRWEGGGLFGGRSLRLTGFSRG